MQLEHGHGNAESTNNNGSNFELKKLTPVVNTPFTVVTTELGSKITIGNVGVSKWYEDEQEALKEAKEVTWNKIMVVIEVWADVKAKEQELKNLIKE